MADVDSRGPLWPYLRRWDEPTFDAEHIAALLSIKPATVRQILLAADSYFPAPSARGANGRNLWTPAAVYSYVLQHRPKLRSRIPRLFIPTTDLNPGQFLHARTVALRPSRWAEPGQSGDQYVLHTWRPSDGGGPIAIAYPVNTSYRDTSAMAAAIELYEQLAPSIEAVAVPCGDASPIRHPDDGIIFQPAMYVVDDSTINQTEPHEQAVEYGWYDIARLLQVDLPWWPSFLRDLGALSSWQPGDPVQRVLPAVKTYSPQPMLDLITPATSPVLLRIIMGLADTIASELAKSSINEAAGYPEYPGLRHAAIADGDPDLPNMPRRANEIALLLHHRVDDATQADRALAAGHSDPMINAVMTISPELAAAHAMIAKWCHDLIPVSPGHRTELGFHQLRRWRPAPATTPTTAVEQWYTHKQDPHIWAVKTQDGTIYTTVGSTVPAAGQLQSAVITSEAGFFETADGAVWPLPHRAGCGYNAGYEGAGPQDLAQSLARLARDAGADVDDPAGRVEVDRQLWQTIKSRPLPITITL